MRKIVAEISSEDSESVRVTLREDGTTVIKTMSFEKYKAGLLSCDTKDELKFRPVRATETYVDGIYNVLKPLTGNFAFFVKGQKQFIFYGGNKDGGYMPFPSLVFYFKLSEGRITGSSVFAVKTDCKKELKDDTELYNYPFGNVSPHTGRICWGGNPLKIVSSVNELEAYIQLFFNAPTNNDLYSPGESINKKIGLPALIKLMQAEDEFDSSLLKEARKTFIKGLEFID